MALDKIIVFVMAIAFFGGLMYLALKGQRGTSRESQPFSSRTQNSVDDVSPPSATAGKGAAEIQRLILVEPG